jgi:hypothetical protein
MKTAAKMKNSLVLSVIALMIVWASELLNAGQSLTCTGEHPFYASNRSDFICAKELNSGDLLQLADHQSAIVESIELEVAAQGERFTTYNFSVAEDHTYFVGESGVWVHNVGPLCVEAEQVFMDAWNATSDFQKAADQARAHLIKRAKGIDLNDQNLADHLKDLDKLIARRLPAPVKTVGQIHHVISTKVARAVDDHPILKGLFAKRDPRFVTQAIDGAAHRGYQRWHRELDDEVVQWIRGNRDKNGDDFLAFLKGLYERPDIKARFPNGF